MEDHKIFTCDCNSFSHQAIFWIDKDDNRLYVTIHLTTHRNIFKRIVVAIKYICGYKSNYGEYDEFLFKNCDKEKLLKHLTE